MMWKKLQIAGKNGENKSGEKHDAVVGAEIEFEYYSMNW